MVKTEISSLSKTLFFVLLYLSGGALSAAQAQDQIEFAQVRTILSDRCFHCHGPDAQNQESGYRMDSEEALMEYIDRGDAESSYLYEKITTDDDGELMPPPDSNRSLTDEEKNIIKLWIQQGAPYEGHWAFELPTRPEVPNMEAAKAAGWNTKIVEAWSQNPIDAFIAERLVSEKLQPSEPADLATRIRRASLTLAGAIPSTALSDQQKDQQTSDTYQAAVNTILESMGYAERQSLRWLDAARYADTDGYQNDSVRKNWPWRDWVIKAFNDNMPFDQFAVEQLAGDMMKEPTYSQRLATAFNRNHRQNAEGGALAEEFLVENVIDRVETTSTVFLGLTFGCSRCHDHKYDPLSQKEFYQMYGYFNNIGERGIGPGVSANPTMIAGSVLRDWDRELLDQVVKAEKDLKQAAGDYKKHLTKWTKEMTALVAKVDQSAKSDAEPPEKTNGTNREDNAVGESTATNDTVGSIVSTNGAVEETSISDAQQQQIAALGEELQKIFRKPDSKRNDGERKKIDRFYAKLDPELDNLTATVKRTRGAFGKKGGRLVDVMVMNERDGEPTPIYLLGRGQYTEPDKKNPLQPGVPDVLMAKGVEQPSSRYQFAKWLVSESNPLTARVIVNRIWRDHFGVGLVKTVDDFGVQGEVPSHPELLDWLAVEFVESGWDVKAMHRLMVTSQAYQQASRMDAQTFENDPENRLLARGPRYRADGFTIRDIALQAAGLLNTQAGGPPVKPYQPTGLWEVVAPDAGTKYVPDKGNKLYRKSMYSFWKRAVNPPRQTIFDAGGREVCSVQVRRTNTPLQALVMMNDQTFVEAARVLAADVLKQNIETDQERLAMLYRRSIGRKIDEPSSKTLAEALEAFREHYRERPNDATELLTVGQHTGGKELKPVEHAAMTMVAHVIMNLDEFLTVE